MQVSGSLAQQVASAFLSGGVLVVQISGSPLIQRAEGVVGIGIRQGVLCLP